MVTRQLRQIAPFLPGVLRGTPPRLYRLDDYKRWFPTTARVFLRYLRRYQPLAGPSVTRAGCGVAVVVSPWVSTPTPWYAVMVAFGLARRGRSVVLLYDDAGFPEEEVKQQLHQITRILRVVGRDLPVVRLTGRGGSAANGAADDELIKRLTQQNLVWRARGGAPKARDVEAAEQMSASLTRTLPLVRACLDEVDVDTVVVPGGVYGTSGLFRHEAQARGWRAATFDADRGIAQICVRGVAAQNGDIARAFESLWAEGDRSRRLAVDAAREEYQRRSEGRDSYGFQARPASGEAETGRGAVLIPMNVEWDTAALGRHVHFADTVDWVTSTVAAVLDSDGGPVVVRQHPSERRQLQRSRLDLRTVLAERFAGDSRVRFVAAEDPVSTYDLLQSSRLVLPFVSTIAIEAAAVGKPVLISGSCYFDSLGFVWAAKSRDEYFSLLHRGLRGELELFPDQCERAWVCYYLTAVRNRLTTDFTPHPADFWSWSRRPPDVLFREPDVADILEALDRDVPVSLLKHRRYVEEQNR